MTRHLSANVSTMCIRWIERMVDADMHRSTKTRSTLHLKILSALNVKKTCKGAGKTSSSKTLHFVAGRSEMNGEEA